MSYPGNQEAREKDKTSKPRCYHLWNVYIICQGWPLDLLSVKALGTEKAFRKIFTQDFSLLSLNSSHLVLTKITPAG